MEHNTQIEESPQAVLTVGVKLSIYIVPSSLTPVSTSQFEIVIGHSKENIQIRLYSKSSAANYSAEYRSLRQNRYQEVQATSSHDSS